MLKTTSVEDRCFGTGDHATVTAGAACQPARGSRPGTQALAGCAEVTGRVTSGNVQGESFSSHFRSRTWSQSIQVIRYSGMASIKFISGHSIIWHGEYKIHFRYQYDGRGPSESFTVAIDAYVRVTSESSSSVGECNAPALSPDSVKVNFKAYTTVGPGHASLRVPGCGGVRPTVTYPSQHFSIHASLSPPQT